MLLTPIIFVGIPYNTRNKMATPGHKSITPEKWQSTPKNTNNHGNFIKKKLVPDQRTFKNLIIFFLVMTS
jgi:hypothetical protein